jgi:hypothetical protein
MKAWFQGLVATVMVVCWLALFFGGLLIGTKDLREKLALHSASVGEIAQVIALWTPSNVAFLAIFAGLAGGAARLIFRQAEDVEGAGSETGVRRIRRETLFGGVIRGFVIYLGLLSGGLVVGGETFSQTSPEQFLRMASTTSLAAFLSSFRPEIFEGLLGVLSNVAGRRT